MADQLPTLLDIVKRRGSDPLVGLIDETIKNSPELERGFARTIKTLQFKTRVRTSLPAVGFRLPNQGVDATKGSVEPRLVECYLTSPRWEADKAVADADEDGPELYISDEGVAMVTAVMNMLCSQFYYGTASDGANGFPGLNAALDASMITDATGNSANAASGVYLVRWGRQDTGWVWGLDGALSLSDVKEVQILGQNNKMLTAYLQEIDNFRPGLMVGKKWSVGKIKNLTTQGGKGLTDALLYKALTMFPSKQPPDEIYLSRRSLEQLRASRTATNATGSPAPNPTEFEGIPLVPTDSIKDTEAIV